MNDKVNDIEENANTAFKQLTESLDSETLHLLRVARETALSKQSRAAWLPVSPSLNLKWLTGAGAGLALASLLTFMIIPNLMSSPALDEFEMLTAEGDMDLVAQLEFYQWIDDSALSE